MARNELQELKHELKLRRSFVFDAYKEPHRLDTKKALETTTEFSRFKQPVVHAWRVAFTKNGAIVLWDFFTPTLLTKNRGREAWYPDELSAWIAARNYEARNAAQLLVDIDARIDKLAVGSGLTNLIMSSIKDHKCDSSSLVSAPSSTSSDVSSDIDISGSGSQATPSATTTSAPPAAENGNATCSEVSPSSGTAKSASSVATKTPSAKPSATTTRPGSPSKSSPSAEPEPAAPAASRAPTTVKTVKSPTSAKPKPLTTEQIKRKADKAEAMSKAKLQ